MITVSEPFPLIGLEVREAKVADAVALALLGRVTFAETFEVFFNNRQGLWQHQEATYSVSKIRSSLQNPNNKFWVATHNALPVGFIKLKQRSTPEVPLPGLCSQLQKIYVLKEYLSKGIGQKLQAALFEQLLQLRTDNVWLYVWERNHRAIRFYEKQGFLVVDQNDQMVGKDVFSFLTMNKTLYRS